MAFNLAIDQSWEVEKFFKGALYKQANKLARRSENLLRLGAFPLASLDGVISITRRVALIAENILKGSANIAGCLVSKKCSLLLTM